MRALELVKLFPLMARSKGRPEITIGLIDGPIAKTHPEFEGRSIRELPGGSGGACFELNIEACRHGTFVAGILSAKRGSAAPAICPGCRLLVRPIFLEAPAGEGRPPGTTAQELATAIVEAVEAAADLLNLSAALAPAPPRANATYNLPWSTRRAEG
jgi:hypothetical protein